MTDRSREGCGFFVSAGAAFGWVWMILTIAFLVGMCDPPRTTEQEVRNVPPKSLVDCLDLGQFPTSSNDTLDRFY